MKRNEAIAELMKLPEDATLIFDDKLELGVGSFRYVEEEYCGKVYKYIRVSAEIENKE